MSSEFVKENFESTSATVGKNDFFMIGHSGLIRLKKVHESIYLNKDIGIIKTDKHGCKEGITLLGLGVTTKDFHNET